MGQLVPKTFLSNICFNLDDFCENNKKTRFLTYFEEIDGMYSLLQNDELKYFTKENFVMSDDAWKRITEFIVKTWSTLLKGAV